MRHHRPAVSARCSPADGASGGARYRCARLGRHRMQHLPVRRKWVVDRAGYSPPTRRPGVSLMTGREAVSALPFNGAGAHRPRHRLR